VARGAAGSPTVAEVLSHVHYVRLILVLEDAPEHARPLPEREWLADTDKERIASRLDESAAVVRSAVGSRLEAGRPMNVHYDHPVLLMQHLLWHEGYHHGQIKLALKASGLALTNETAGPLTWGVWMRKA
jgi:uncharacterized damage-inducible protein DinB